MSEAMNGAAPVDAAPENAVDTANEAPETDNVPADGEAEGTEAAPTDAKAAGKKAAPAQKAANKRKFKLKVDGKEMEEEVDLDNEDYLTKQLQLAKAAQKRMSEYSTLEKEVTQFLSDLKNNPRKVLSDPRIGLDVKKLAAEIIEEEIENSRKSPEQIEKEKLEARLRELEDERKKEQEDFRKKEFDRLQQQEYQRYDQAMSQALEKSDLPKSPYIIKKMADYMLMGIKQGMDVSPEDVLPLVKEEMNSDLKEMFSAMPDEVIEALVGKDVIGRIRKKNIAKVKANPPTPIKAQLKDSGQKTEKKQEAPASKVSFKDFFGI